MYTWHGSNLGILLWMPCFRRSACLLDLQVQDSKLHNGNGVYLHMVNLLQQGEDAASQGLAADLFQALLSSYGNLIGKHWVSTSTKVCSVPHLPPAFNCSRLLEVISSSSNLKVPALGPFVLILSFGVKGCSNSTGRLICF